MRIAWLFTALVLSMVIAALEQWALAEYLYWRYVWFDVPMHFLGGLTIAVFLIAILERFSPRLFLIGFVLVAIGWELLEYVIGTPREANFIFDTALDLLMDALGASVAYVVARFTLWRSA